MCAGNAVLAFILYMILIKKLNPFNYEEKKCTFCGSKNAVKKNGRYGNGKQRWYCERCKRSFTWNNKSNKQKRESVWFGLWVREGYAIGHLASISQHSPRKLRYIINYWLNREPPLKKERIERCHYTVFDGTFLKRPDSIIILMDAQDHTVIASSYPTRENSLSQLRAFLVPLKEHGLSLESVTVDGNPHAIRAFKELWPDIMIQRCLVHIQRQGLMWCRAKPKMELAKELRGLFLRSMYIRTHQERGIFVRDLMEWEKRYGDMVNSLPSDHKMLSDLKRARSMILKALPDMFHYLNDKRIPFSTNGLEGYFSRVKWGYRNHRGLAAHKRINYFKWYTFLKEK